MHAAKIHLLLTILATQIVALFVGGVPYFPIEISRTAASSKLASGCLSIGAITLIITLVAANELTPITFMMWAGLLIVALIPDNVFMLAHMLGVVIIGVAACLHVFSARSTKDGRSLSPLLVSFAMIYSLRWVLKVGVMLLHDPAINRPGREWTHVNLLSLSSELTERALDIMLNGERAFGGNTAAWNDIRPLFQVAGVLQWVAFYTLSLVL